MTKTLVQQAKVRTNTVKDSVCAINVPVVKFSDLWSAYPRGKPYVDKNTGKPPSGYENQCAIKVSAAIHGAGVEMKSFKGVTVSTNNRMAAVRAAELADWLKLQPFCGLPKMPENVAGPDWQEKIKDKTGIVYFSDYWYRSEAESKAKTPTGDHIDLWNGSRLTATGWSAISTLGRRLGLNELTPDAPWGFSDMRKSRVIFFWQIR